MLTLHQKKIKTKVPITYTSNDPGLPWDFSKILKSLNNENYFSGGRVKVKTNFGDECVFHIRGKNPGEDNMKRYALVKSPFWYAVPIVRHETNFCQFNHAKIRNPVFNQGDKDRVATPNEAADGGVGLMQITKPGTGEGTPQTLPPAWDFSGTGKYNIIYCNRVSDTSQTLGDTGIKNMTINEKTLYTVSVSSLGRTAKDLIYEIARQAQTTAGGALAKFEILNGLIRTNDNGTKPAGACPVCHNNSLQEISFEIFYENVNGLVSLPAWDFWQSSRACPHIKSQWDSFFAKCKAHELHHANVDFSRDVTANLKTRIGSIKYCSLTSSNTNISPMIIDLQNKLILELRTNFSDLVNWSTKNSAFDVIDTPLTQPEKFFTEPTHPLYSPCGRP